MDRVKPLIAAWLLVGLGMIPTGAMGQTDVNKEPGTARFGNPTATGRQLQDYFYGVVKSVKPKEVILEKTKFGIDQAIILNEKTKYVRDGKASKLDDLKKGEQVWIRIKTNKKTGAMTAKVVLTGVVAPTVEK